MSKSKRSSFRPAGHIVVIAISMLSMLIALAASSVFGTWEAASADLRMRWRATLFSKQSDRPEPAIVLVAIDAQTVTAIGRYGAGEWIARNPYFDQLAFFRRVLRPTVVAYDIIFENPLGDRSRGTRSISESTEDLHEIASQITDLAENPGSDLPDRTMLDINRLSFEQGNVLLAHRFAGIKESHTFKSLLGFNFRGGSVDRNTVEIQEWNDRDVYGDDPSGDEEWGERIPYLNDMAIPSTDLHLPVGREPPYKYSPNANMPSIELLDYVNLAPLNVPRDADGVVRRIPLIIGFKYTNSKKGTGRRVFMPSFALTSALLHMGVEFPLKNGTVEVFMGDRIVIRPPNSDQFEIPIDDTGRMYLDFNAGFNDFDGISFANVAPSRNSAEAKTYRFSGLTKSRIDGKIAIVGVTVTGMDVGPTPLYANIPLVFVQMTAANNILSRRFIRPLRGLETVFLSTILFLTFTLVCAVERTAKLGPATVLFSLLYLVAAYGGVHMSIAILPIIGPLLYIGLCSFATLSYRFLIEERDKRKIRGMFSTMVSDKVLAYLEESPESFSLRGQNVQATVFFSDIADFTSIGERLAPDELTELLNRYLTPITDCIIDNGGYLDKYVGDGVVAVWGAPYQDPEHAINACRAAIEQRHLLRQLNERMAVDFGTELQVRMGINSGTVTAGNMGSERKFQYTVIGDVVNLASRIEPINKDFGTNTIIGHATKELIGDTFVTRKLSTIIVLGKTKAVPVYELVGTAGEVDTAIMEMMKCYEAALDLYSQREWDRCISSVNSILESSDDEPSRRLAAWAKQMKATPPNAEWCGEYVRLEK